MAFVGKPFVSARQRSGDPPHKHNAVKGALQDRAAIRFINGLGNAVRRIGWEIPSFDPERLERTACRQTGLRDFGPERYRTPFARLCQSYADDPHLTTFGRIVVSQMLTALLQNRLRIAQALQEDPGIRQEVVQRPLFVLGLPRTGTTLLFNLLAQDPVCRPLNVWETMQPAPPPRLETYQTDPRIAMARSRMARLNRALPELAHIHEFPLSGPEECLGLLMNTFVTPFFRGRVPSYRDWLDEISEDEVDAAYAEYQSQLQLLQRHVKGSHWILKCPSHLFGLGSLLRTFPDACVVQTHRDLAKSAPSLFSLSETVEQLCYHPVRRDAVVQTILRSMDQLLQRGLRGRLSADRDGRHVLDINFEDLVARPVEMVERIYARFGYPFTPDFRQRIEQFLADDAKRRTGVQHQYALDEYGLTSQQLYERFSFYTARLADHFPQSRCA